MKILPQRSGAARGLGRLVLFEKPLAHFLHFQQFQQSLPEKREFLFIR